MDVRLIMQQSLVNAFPNIITLTYFKLEFIFGTHFLIIFMHSFSNILIEEDAYESRIAKNSVLERWDTDLFEEVALLLSYNPVSREIDLAHSLNQHLSREYPQLGASTIFHFNCEIQCYEQIGVYPFQTEVLVKYEDIQDEPLHFRIQPVRSQAGGKPKPYQKYRPKERTIHDVLMKVAEWRKISKSEKVSLEQAAKLVGLSRKTLDDYYLQIKLAETHGFDFQAHEYHGVGVLRRFVKQRHVKKSVGDVKILSKYKCKTEWESVEERVEDEGVKRESVNLKSEYIQDDI